jgi:hypothetical protein
MANTDIEQRLVKMANEGLLSFEKIALACLAFMSADDVAEMARAEELIDFTEEEVTFEVRDDDSGKVMYITDDMDLADEEAQVIADSQQKVMTIFQITDNGGWEDELDSYYP